MTAKTRNSAEAVLALTLLRHLKVYYILYSEYSTTGAKVKQPGMAKQPSERSEEER